MTVRDTACAATIDADDLLLGLVGDIHEAALEPEMWPAVLDRVSDALGGVAIHMGIQHLPAGIDFVASSRLDPSGIEALRRRYNSVETNPILKAAASMPAGIFMSRQAVVDDATYFASDLYADCIGPEGMVDWRMALLVKEPGLVAPFVVSWQNGRPTLDSQGKSLLDRLLPHLRRSIQITERLGRLEADRVATRETFDLLPYGVVILDDEGRIIEHNVLAQRLLAAKDGLTVSHGRLTCAGNADASRFRDLVAGAVATARGKRLDGAGGAMSVARPSDGRPYAVLVGPLREAGATRRRGSPAAVAFISDPEAGSPHPEAMLRQLYGLTAAEAALAGCLLAGHDLNDAADLQGIGRETARTHLRRIFAKTETRRQSELMRVLLRGPAGLDSPEHGQAISHSACDEHHQYYYSITR